MGKLIVVCPELHARGPGDNQSLERTVRRFMEKSKGTVTSASGMTASLAINYCERMDLPYRVQRGKEGMYYVERLT